MALLTEDYETLCLTYAELGAAGPSIDFDAFQEKRVTHSHRISDFSSKTSMSVRF